MPQPAHAQTEPTQSTQLFQEAQHYMPGGVNSPVRAFQAVGGSPRFIREAKGAVMIDVDGNRYIDYVGSWGPLITGHADPHVLEAVKKAIERGLSFGAPCSDEVTLAKTLCRLMPNMDQVRLVNSGTEATMSAIRLARGFTKRNKIIKFEGCYHGHSDTLLVKAGSGALTFGHPSSPGVPESVIQHTLIATYNDLSSVEALFETHGPDIAAVLLEPIPGNMNLLLPRPGFLQGLRDLCDQYQSLLIFDEVMSGFRVSLGGAQALYSIKPDLTCLGKIIGGGMPVGAFGGRGDIMSELSPIGPVYQAGTLSGNPIAMAAGLALLEQIQAPGFYESLGTKTQTLMQGFSEAAKEAGVPLVTHSIGGMFGFFFTEQEKVDTYAAVMACDAKRFTRFFQTMLSQGIYLAPSAFEAGFMSSAHSAENIQATRDALGHAFGVCCR